MRLLGSQLDTWVWSITRDAKLGVMGTTGIQNCEYKRNLQGTAGRKEK